MPRRLGQLASRLESGTLKVGVAPTDLENFEGVVRSAANRIGSSIIVAALLVSSSLIARVHDLRWLAAVGFALSFVLGLYMVWKIIRTPARRARLEVVSTSKREVMEGKRWLTTGTQSPCS